MKHIIILIILAFSFIQNSSAQLEYKFEYLDSLTQDCVNQLKKENIDTILVYIDDCVTGDSFVEIMTEDSCFYWGNPPKAYCFWKNDNKTFLKRIEYETCYDYFTIEYNIDSIWNFAFEKKDRLINERIKPKVFVENSDTLEVWIDHYCFYDLLIMDRQDTLVYHLCNFFFEKNVSDEFENLSYYDNWSTNRKQLQLMLQDIIATIDDKLLREKKYK